MRRPPSFVWSLALLLACDSSSSAPPQVLEACDPDAPKATGEATYYTEADGSGNCSFPATPNDLFVGAMNQLDYANSAACGACATIDGPNGSITVRIVDRCPECAKGDIDLSPVAFDQIAPRSAGRVPIQWRYVPCDVSGNLVFHFKDGSNPWWTAIQVRNHRTPIATLEARLENGTYRSLERVEYNYFLAEDGLGQGPYTLRVTDVDGNVIEVTGVPLLDDANSATTMQFPACR